MNRWEKEVQQSLLDSEGAAIDELEKQYKRAFADINQKVKQFQTDIDLLDAAMNQEGLDDTTKAMLKSQKRSKIYQKQYQEALKSQVSSVLDKMQGDNYTTIDNYLKGCYETGYIGTMYSIAGQGIPIIVPIDQAAAVKAILTDSKVRGGYYAALGVNVASLKKVITQEISRGIASGLPYRDIARNINNASGSGLYNAKRITRTEGHRIQQTSARDAQYAAKAKGADVVKQWDAALDGRTRDSHARVDGEIRELDEKFSNGLRFPGDPYGSAAEVINCRCTCDTRARWALDDEELQTLKDRAEYFGLDKTENFEDFRKKYLTAAEKAVENSGGSATIKTDFSESNFKSLSGGNEANDFFYFDDDKRGLLAKRNSQYGKWMNNLENGTRPVIADYCADAYDDINKYWRRIGDWQNIDADRVKYQTDLIDKAISSFNLKDGIQTYRGIDLDTIIQLFPDAEELSDLVGQSFSDNAFSSTSPVRSVAEKFASQNGQDGVLLQLFVPSGAGRGAYINQLSGFQNDEYEFLLKRNAKFEVFDVDTSGGMPIVKGRWIE